MQGKVDTYRPLESSGWWWAMGGVRCEWFAVFFGRQLYGG